MEYCCKNEGCSLSTSLSYFGSPLVVLENMYVKLSVIPDYGAKIYEFIYKPFGHNLMWENERLRGRRAYYGANYDNFITGGFEDTFPTVLPSNYKGEELPFFGEVWSVPWQYDILCLSPETVSVRFQCDCAVYPVKVEKTITLEKNALKAVIKYRIINLSNMEMDYMWGIHPGISIGPGSIVKIPETFYNINVCQTEDINEFKNGVGRFRWPNLNGIDLTRTMDVDRTVLSIYSDPLKEGWLDIFDVSRAIGFRMDFDVSIFDILSIWLMYGGWRGHYCIMAEAFTSWPLALDKAVEKGTARKLTSKEIVETDVSISITTAKE